MPSASTNHFVCAAPSALIRLAWFLIHALTGVATKYRPFGPKLNSTRYNFLTST